MNVRRCFPMMSVLYNECIYGVCFLCVHIYGEVRDKWESILIILILLLFTLCTRDAIKKSKSHYLLTGKILSLSAILLICLPPTMAVNRCWLATTPPNERARRLATAHNVILEVIMVSNLSGSVLLQSVRVGRSSAAKAGRQARRAPWSPSNQSWHWQIGIWHFIFSFGWKR